MGRVFAKWQAEPSFVISQYLMQYLIGVSPFSPESWAVEGGRDAAPAASASRAQQKETSKTQTSVVKRPRAS